MITQFEILGDFNERKDRYASKTYFSFYSKNFPVDLKMGDKICMPDFKDYITIGDYALFFNNISGIVHPIDLCKIDQLPECVVVVDVVYGKIYTDIVKVLTLKIV